MLQDKIKKLVAEKGLLLMPHLVLGYPSYAENEKVVTAMIEAGADIIELQLPFSESMSDGPVIMRASDAALKAGATTTKGIAFVERMRKIYPTTLFVVMTYANILFAYGLSRFLERMKACDVQGLIVPDLPPEEGGAYLALCEKEGLAPIFIFTPTATPERLALLSKATSGMAYCVGRKGVTGVKTAMDQSITDVITRYRAATDLPLAFGFGIQNAEDVAFMKGRVEIAVLGTKLIQIHEEQGAEAVGAFLKSVRG